MQVPEVLPKGKNPGLHYKHLAVAAASSACTSLVALKQFPAVNAAQLALSASLAI